MPGMDGFMCIRVIRDLIIERQAKNNSDLVKLPYFCCVTAYTSKSLA